MNSKSITEKLLIPYNAFAVVLLVSFAALGTALAAQIFFGLKPCVLCIWQRLPYLLLILNSVAALLLLRRVPDLTNYMLIFCLLFFIGSFGISFFHNGVEQGWWSLEGGCPIGAAMENKTEEQALAELLTTPMAKCDEITWRILGFSVTVWNALLSLIMSIYLGVIVARENRQA